MAEVFAFRPAPLRGPQEWQLEDGRLHGPSGTLALDRVRRLRLVDRRYGDARMLRLDLIHDDGTLDVSLTIGALAPEETPDLAAWSGLVAALGHAFSAQDPGLEVEIGEGGLAGWGMFVVGLLSLLAGLGIGLGAAMSGLAGDRLAAAALPVLLLIGLGWALVYGNRPWRARPCVPVSGLALLLSGRAGGR